MSTELIQIIHDDVKEIKKEMQEVKVTNAVQNEQLREHMRRTENLEKRINKMDVAKWSIGIIGAITAAYLKYKGVY